MTDQQRSRALIIADTLDASLPKIAEAIPSRIGLPAARVVRIAKQAINLNPALAECSGQSIANACMKAAADGLVCDGREAALVPFKRKKKDGAKWVEWSEATYIIMYRGMIKMMYRSGIVSTVEVMNVHQLEYDTTDRFEYERGLNPKLRHVPIMLGERGLVVAVYSIIGMRDGGKTLNVMTVDDILDTVGERALTVNPLWKSEGGKQTHNLVQMYRKTVLRAHSKLLPFESDISAAFDDHGAGYDDGYEPDADAAPGEPEIQVPRKRKGAAAAALNPKPEPEQETMDPETGELSGGEPLEADTI